MEDKKEQKMDTERKGLSRRGFLKLAGKAIIGAAASQSLPNIGAAAKGVGEGGRMVEQLQQGFHLEALEVADLNLGGLPAYMRKPVDELGTPLFSKVKASIENAVNVTRSFIATKSKEKGSEGLKDIQGVTAVVLGKKGEGQGATPEPYVTPTPPASGQKFVDIFVTAPAYGFLVRDKQVQYYSNNEVIDAIGKDEKPDFSSLYVFPTTNSTLVAADLKTGKPYATGILTEKAGVEWAAGKVMTSDEVKAAFPEAVKELPDHTFIVDKGVAKKVSLDGPRFIGNEKKLTVFTKDGSARLVWKDVSGWTMPTYSTNIASVFIDSDYTEKNGARENYKGAAKLSYVFDAQPVTSVKFVSDDPVAAKWLDLSNKDTANSLKTFRGEGFNNSVLSVNPEDGNENLDNGILTFFAMLQYKSEKPTADQLKGIKDKYFNSQEAMVVETPTGKWDLRKGVDIVLGPFPEKGSNTIMDTLPDNPFSTKDGKGTIYMTSVGINSWGATTSVDGAMARTLTKAGISTSYGEDHGRNHYPELTKNFWPIVEDKAKKTKYILPIVKVGLGDDGVGGNLDYRSYAK